jgi:carboxyl-terminal processing protease
MLPWVLGVAVVVPVAAPVSFPAAALAQAGCPGASPTPAPSAEPLLMPEDNRLQLFEQVWGAIDAAYLDPTFNGKDWEAIGDQYAPLFLQVEDAWEIYDLTAEMVEQLDDPGVRFISPLIIENLPPQEQDYVGIGALVDTSVTEETGEGPHILYLFEGSGAIDAGIKPRDQIVSVDGDPCVSIRKIRGPEGTTVTLGVRSPGEEPRDVVVERRRIDPTVHPSSELLGTDGSIGLLRLNSMEGQQTLDGVVEILTDFRTRSLEGLVIDARSVSLGGLGVTAGILSHLLEGDAGTFYSRLETTPLALPDSDLPRSFKDLPIVVLLDEDSAGEPERLAAILQSTGRAQVVGQPTDGETRVIQDIPYPDGSVLSLVTIGLELPDGTKLERQGITPDVRITEDWLAFPAAQDPYLMAALELLGAGATPSPSPSSAPSPSPVPSPSPSPSVSPVPATSATASPEPTSRPTKKPRKRTPRP